MNNDQWFEPGDKVMRVHYGPETVTQLPGHARTIWVKSDERTHFGNVLCVEACWFDPRDGYNTVSFVGIANGDSDGFYACCFRKVEEIKLCVEASKKLNRPVTEEVPAQGKQLRESHAELVSALEEAMEYFADRQDADHNGSRFIPNEEMQQFAKLSETLANAAKLTGE